MHFVRLKKVLMFNSTSKFLYDKFKAKNWIYSLILLIHVTKVFKKKIYCKFRGKNQTQLTRIHNFSPEIKKKWSFSNNFEQFSCGLDRNWEFFTNEQLWDVSDLFLPKTLVMTYQKIWTSSWIWSICMPTLAIKT